MSKGPLAFLCLLPIALSRIDPDVGLNTTEFLSKYNYQWENHDIVTEDNYIITFQRIPSKTNGPAVLLLHGILSSSVDFINMGPENSLGLILANKGYDVWLGNSRGNAWSRKHKTLTPKRNPKEFFDFSWHEMGYYDLAAAVDHILGVVGQKQLYFIGHSQGGSAFVVLTSTRPEYNKKFKAAMLMAPPPLRTKFDVFFLQIVAENAYLVEDIANLLKIYEWPLSGITRKLLGFFCGHFSIAREAICKQIYLAFGKSHTPDNNKDKLAVVFSNLPSNSACKQFYHYGQEIKNKRFAWYDYRKRRNLEKYGTPKPPTYHLSNVTAPVGLYYGKTDTVVIRKDVEKLATVLPNVVSNVLIPKEIFNHIDFLYAKNVSNVVYKGLIETMEKY